MIFGIGTDILEISRIDKILKKYNQTFVSRIFGSNEIKIIEKKSKKCQNKGLRNGFGSVEVCMNQS